ncbi:MAG: hydroxysqualene dehydroxylase HpnE [Melioribacteraceae bacterium]|nr:hydroxysqualene dehydroxylase HpnE [Melioribacteraceae bacterium]
MKKVIVIGGGLSGLSSAVSLLKNGFQVELLESSPKLGGRTYSLKHPKFDNMIDNGQHILLGCYYATLDYLNTIGSEQFLSKQKFLKIPFVNKGGKVSYLNSESDNYPLNLSKAIFKFDALSMRDRIKVIDFFLDLFFVDENDHKNQTVEQFLIEKKQNSQIISHLWDILVIGALNTTIDKADAAIFIRILKTIFFEGNDASSIYMASTNLNDLFINNAVDYLNNHHGIISLNETVKELVFENEKITKIITDKREILEYDFVITSIPPYAFQKITNNKIIPNLDEVFSYSPILNVHIKLKDNIFSEPFYTLLESDIHWIFNKGKHITLVTSSAEKYMGMDYNNIIGQFCSELKNYFPIFDVSMILDFLVIKEKRATFIPTKKTEKFRKNFINNYGNLFIAGDWVNTGLPSTIESAILSGQMAVNSIGSI